MSTELRTRLADLADSAPAGTPPDDLWRRGVRRRRTRRAAVVVGGVVAVLAVLVGGVVPGLVAPDKPPVAGLPDSAAIPDRLVTPPGRLAGTSEGPIGPLAVIAGAARERGRFGTSVENGVVAISATTGEYRFLDLPDAYWSDDSPDQGVTLSPDGRHVAYWLRHPDHEDWAGGWAVYDTVTGKVARHRAVSPLGIDERLLTWAGPGRLVVGYGVVFERREDGYSSLRGSTDLWTPSMDSTQSLSSSVPDIDWVAPTSQGFATFDDRRLAQWRWDEDGPVSRVDVRGGDPFTGTVSPNGGVLVTLDPDVNDAQGSRMRIGAVGQYGVKLSPLDVDLPIVDLLGWTDADHVVVRAARGPRQTLSVHAVDVRTGEHELLVHEQRENWNPQPKYATQLLARPTVPRPMPAGPTPWWWYVAGAGGLVATVYGVRRWRRGQA